MRNIIVLSVVFSILVIGAVSVQAQGTLESALAEIAARGEVTVIFAAMNQNIAHPLLTELDALGIVTINYDDSGFDSLPGPKRSAGAVVRRRVVDESLSATYELGQLDAAGVVTVIWPSQNAPG